MSTISASVGKKGVNSPPDVKTVQKLLNNHIESPMKPLVVDGLSGPATIKAIKHFQSNKVGLKNPDGRVDPGGKTLRKLKNMGDRSEAKKDIESLPPEQRRSARKDRGKFVRPQVKETAKTTKIIDAIYPHFKSVRATVISGFLNDSDLFWKVNYHWEYLSWMVEHSLKLGLSPANRKKLQSLRSSLMSCKPDPDTGYRTSAKVGKPEDRSSAEEANKRYNVMRQGKKTFKKVFDEDDLKSKSQRGARAFDLAAAPVARPGTSKHRTGHALDIEGDNGKIKSKCKGLGATLTFDEKSHVHVEFAKGVSTQA